MNLISQMKTAGLGRAMRDAQKKTHLSCGKGHSTFHKRAYNYCPHCGIKLQIFKTCTECRKNFYSEKSYEGHKHHKDLPQCVCRATGDRLQLIFGSRYRCLESGHIFDWAYKGLKSKRKQAIVVFNGFQTTTPGFDTNVHSKDGQRSDR